MSEAVITDLRVCGITMYLLQSALMQTPTFMKNETLETDWRWYNL
jgi:hypothetical protein